MRALFTFVFISIFSSAFAHTVSSESFNDAVLESEFLVIGNVLKWDDESFQVRTSYINRKGHNPVDAVISLDINREIHTVSPLEAGHDHQNQLGSTIIAACDFKNGDYFAKEVYSFEHIKQMFPITPNEKKEIFLDRHGPLIIEKLLGLQDTVSTQGIDKLLSDFFSNYHESKDPWIELSALFHLLTSRKFNSSSVSSAEKKASTTVVVFCFKDHLLSQPILELLEINMLTSAWLAFIEHSFPELDENKSESAARKIAILSKMTGSDKPVNKSNIINRIQELKPKFTHGDLHGYQSIVGWSSTSTIPESAAFQIFSSVTGVEGLSSEEYLSSLKSRPDH